MKYIVKNHSDRIFLHVSVVIYLTLNCSNNNHFQEDGKRHYICVCY
jgi:hypothetical protein